MDNMKKRNIKDFSVEGIALDQEVIIRIRKQLEDTLEDEMREKGYVPVLDLTPELWWDYQVDDENFQYVIRKYGVFVGKKKSKEILGMLGFSPIKYEKES